MIEELQIRQLGLGYNDDGSYRGKWVAVGRTVLSGVNGELLREAREYRRENEYEARIFVIDRGQE